MTDQPDRLVPARAQLPVWRLGHCAWSGLLIKRPDPTLATLVSIGTVRRFLPGAFTTTPTTLVAKVARVAETYGQASAWPFTGAVTSFHRVLSRSRHTFPLHLALLCSAALRIAAPAATQTQRIFGVRAGANFNLSEPTVNPLGRTARVTG